MLDSTGTVWCVGNSDANRRLSFAEPLPLWRFADRFPGTRDLTDVLSIEGGRGGACAVTRRGELLCWGRAARACGARDDVPYRVALPQPALRVSVGEYQICAAGSLGDVWCCGTVHGADPFSTGGSPSRIPLSSATKALASSAEATCALDVTGRVSCWGTTYGLHGRNVSWQSRFPAVIWEHARAVAAGDHHFCAITDDVGHVECFGGGDRGALGVPDASAVSPARVPGILGASVLSAGARHTLALVGSEARCWGSDYYERAGLDLANSRDRYKAMTIATDVVDVRAAQATTCVLTTTGILACTCEFRFFGFQTIWPSATGLGSCKIF